MGDEGLCVGACVDFILQSIDAKSLNRERLQNVYLGWPYKGHDLIEEAKTKGFKVLRTKHAANEAASLLAEHKVGAIFNGRMEMGPRALGARTILANPSKRDVNDSINKRLQRTEFMPFAPYVCDVDADEVFELSPKVKYACRFMTVTANVKEHWRESIAAVVHVDGTARPQIIERGNNELYYDVLQSFKAKTGLPVLVNTSFNAHEEPIINTPNEALEALASDRIDFLLCSDGLVFNGKK